MHEGVDFKIWLREHKSDDAKALEAAASAAVIKEKRLGSVLVEVMLIF